MGNPDSSDKGKAAPRIEAAPEKTPTKTPAKPKMSPRPPATKAEHAAFKRTNKTAFKPAPRKS
jgi:hypothetical protein